MKQHKLDEILRECLIENYEVMNQQDINVSLSAKSYTIVFSENHKDIFKKFKNSNPDKIVNSYIKKYLNDNLPEYFELKGCYKAWQRCSC